MPQAVTAPPPVILERLNTSKEKLKNLTLKNNLFCFGIAAFVLVLIAAMLTALFIFPILAIIPVVAGALSPLLLLLMQKTVIDKRDLDRFIQIENKTILLFNTLNDEIMGQELDISSPGADSASLVNTQSTDIIGGEQNAEQIIDNQLTQVKKRLGRISTWSPKLKYIWAKINVLITERNHLIRTAPENRDEIFTKTIELRSLQITRILNILNNKHVDTEFGILALKRLI